MSKIVSPYPPMPLKEDYRPPDGARWWRFVLQRNEDGYSLIMECDAFDETSRPTWCSWEFFDGENVIIDVGLDRPLPAVLTERLGFGWIDVLSVDRPTPSRYWEKLPIPGNWPHPESQKESVVLGYGLAAR